MVKSCCIKGCNSECHAYCGLSFHRFPKNENLRAKWLEAIGREITCKTPFICSRHFKKEDFKSTFPSRLQDDAVPRIVFPNNPGASTSTAEAADTGSLNAEESTLTSLILDSDDEPTEQDAEDSEQEVEDSEQEVHYTSIKECQNGRMRLSHGAGSAGSLLPDAPAYSLQQELLMDLHEISDKIQNLYPTALGKQFTLTFKGEDGDKSEYVFTSASETRRSGERHSGLRCNECGSDIIGFRYKCVSCADYDLCSACEALGTHADHLMMRIAKPLKLKQARRLLQRWCEAMKTAGVTTTEELTTEPNSVHAVPITSASRDPVSTSLLLEIGPINTKPKVIKKTLEGKMKASKKEGTLPLKRIVEAKKKIDTPKEDSGAKKRRIVSLERDSASEIESTIKDEPLEHTDLADYYDSFAETEPTVQVEEVKVEDPDPLGTDAVVKTEDIEETSLAAPDPMEADASSQPYRSHLTETCITTYTYKTGR